MEKKLRNIAMIGPVYPYKGGIAHYTGLMYQALAKKYDVTMISYKMQYPKILFKKEQRDYSNKTFQIENTEYAINTASPINWITVSKMIKKIRPDLIIIQWWHPYFTPCYYALSNLLKDFDILFICHNVFPHKRFPIDGFLTKNVLKNGTYYIVQSLMDKTDLLSIIPKANCVQTVHPTYNAFNFTNISQQNARVKLGIPIQKKVLLFFGFVREYKGLKYLIQALPEIIKNYQDIELLIVGDFDKDKKQYLDIIQKEHIESYIRIFDAYIPDNEIENYFSASDLVICPYVSATQSGIVQMAYGFEKPVIVTNVGGLPDAIIDGETGYVVEAESSDEIAKAVIKYFKKNNKEYFRKRIIAEMERYSWDRMIEIIELQYYSIYGEKNEKR